MASSPKTQYPFLDIIPDMCFVLSGDLVVLECNQRAREITGLSEPVDGTTHFLSLLTPDSPHPPFTALSLNSGFLEAEVRFKQITGLPLEAHLSVRCLQDDSVPIYYIIARDVSDAKRRELDLLRFSNVVHYTVNPIQITDVSGRMVYVNPAFERATGFSSEELIGRNPKLISSGKYSKEFWEKVWRTISSGKVWNGEIENKRKNGDPLYTQILISPIIDNDGRVVGYLGSHRDVTEQKALEQQLVHAQKMESIGTLAAGIAHEVGNPLASISSIVQVLLRTMNDAFAKDKLVLVQAQVHRITKIIRDLVDFSRPSNYQVQPTDLVKNLSDSIEIVKMGKKARDITFNTNVHHRIPLLSLVPDQISQVFINILLNAVDALQGKKGTITIEVERDAEHVRVSITDDGTGIEPENLRKVFEPFFTTKRAGEGTGLGLWVSYGIVKSFRGDLTVQSTFGTGTTFCLILPLNPKEYRNV